MLDTFTVATFEPHIGATFRARLPDATSIDLTLVEASSLAADSDARRQRAPFRLIFRDPARRIARQGIYDVAHDALAPMSIFLVPVQADASGTYVEAIFT
ncbi:MAG TPA: hypothetical protein VGM50_00325 [Gemmatimonadaceae bacterium]|jgi:hypothetical protein